LRSYIDDGVVDKIRAAGGEVYAVTSEPQHLADQAHTHWDLRFENIGDPHQEIPRVCNERDWLTLYASRGKTEFLQRGADWKVEHPKGFFQPGVLVVNQSSVILYRWRSVPSEKNLNGTVARPTPMHVWNAIENALASGSRGVHAPLDENPQIDAPPPPKLVFIAALIANAWFLGVKSFAYSPGAEETPKRFAKAFKRWPFFIALWVLAFVFLPAAWVSAAATLWVAWIAYDVRATLDAMNVQVEVKAVSASSD
jgi:hypothetical protein